MFACYRYHIYKDDEVPKGAQGLNLFCCEQFDVDKQQECGRLSFRIPDQIFEGLDDKVREKAIIQAIHGKG